MCTELSAWQANSDPSVRVFSRKDHHCTLENEFLFLVLFTCCPHSIPYLVCNSNIVLRVDIILGRPAGDLKLRERDLIYESIFTLKTLHIMIKFCYNKSLELVRSVDAALYALILHPISLVRYNEIVMKIRQFDNTNSSTNCS